MRGTTSIERRKCTPPQVAKMWGCDVLKILRVIRTGELRAINVASPGRNQRPRYLIDVADLEDFERRREVQPPPKACTP
jgi:hypothetical protein